MNSLNNLVNSAIKKQPELSSLRIVVEKELLHHDILRILSQSGLLSNLTFIGGTALRACYAGNRLSEDLDFTGGKNFSRESLKTLKEHITSGLYKKYGLTVAVGSPTKEEGNVDTWRIKVETTPNRKDLPSQRINIDVCKVNSYDSKPTPLLNLYGIDMGTDGLIIDTQSKSEIYTDKILAFALRPNRIKYRDLWDILWLHQQGQKPNYSLVHLKLNDRNLTEATFQNAFSERISLLQNQTQLFSEFKKEMQRFLPQEKFQQATNNSKLWEGIIEHMTEIGNNLKSDH